MGNTEHYNVLKQGVDVWNEWRLDNPNTTPDLESIDFGVGTNLDEFNLSGARLQRTILKECYLCGADLSQSDCYLANFNETRLDNANLSGAKLYLANLSMAMLPKANFEKTHLWETIFGDTDLSNAKGLVLCYHEGPCTLDHRTIIRSGGLPDVFLRGCGLADWQIEAARLHSPALNNQEISDVLYKIHDLRANRVIQTNPLFISYSHADSDFVDALEAALHAKGIRFWRDIHDAISGRLELQVDRAIRHNPTVLLILSSSSVNSDWVQHEARMARKLEREIGRDVLCPVALDTAWKSCRWPERLREQIMEYNILDFSDWKNAELFERKFSKLLSGLDAFYREQ